MTRQFGIIGFPLVHSFSKKYFTERFAREGMDCQYLNFEIEDAAQVREIVKAHPALEGFNVTIPHKKSIIPLLDGISDEAAAIGAVNCVKVADGKLTGYNTDVYGFERSLLQLIGDQRPPALVLGTGGASLAAGFVLKKLGIDFRFVSRSHGDERLTYDMLDDDIMALRRLIVNTTPLGTYPNVDTLPDIPYDRLMPGHYLFDMVYNPPLTRFLAEGRQRGAHTANGADMLVGQAEKSWEIWNG